MSNRLGADELRAAREAQKWDLLWTEALPLVKHAIKKLSTSGVILSQADRDDLYQEGVLAAGSAVRSWNPEEGMFSTWIIPRVTGALRDYVSLRASGMVGSKGSFTVVGSYDGDYLPSKVAPQDSIVQKQQDTSVLHLALSRLSESERDVITASYGLGREQETMAVIAARRGIPVITARRLVEAALKKMSKCINNFRYLPGYGKRTSNDVNKGSNGSALQGVGSGPARLAEGIPEL